MRIGAVAVLVLLAACQQQHAKAPAKPPEFTFDGALASDAAALREHGKRLTWVLGCRGCHGPDLQGTFFTKDEPQYGPLYASNLTVELPEYSDAQLDGIIRHGVHPERKTVWGMPSELFQHLSDPDFKALVADLRTLKPSGKKLPPPQFSKLDKEEIKAGEYEPAIKLVPERAAELPVDLGPKYALGRYITEVTCAECHGPELEGKKPPQPGMPPDLVVVGGYSRAEFETLITKGIPVGGRKLREMMSGVAQRRFTHMTQHERDALYAYLKARAEQSH